MPMRSFDSPILKWPKLEEVHRALSDWAVQEAANRPELLRVGYIGSYARGDWGVGSDLDVVLVVRETAEPWIERGRHWDLTSLPVPADLLIYSRAEFEQKIDEASHLSRELQRAAWVYVR